MKTISIAYQLHPQGIFIPVVQVTVAENNFQEWYEIMKGRLDAYISNNCGFSWSMLTE